MAASSQVLTIQEFLLAHVLGDADPDDRAGPEPVDDPRRLDPSDPEGLALTGAALRAEIERHNDRTMTVVSRGDTQRITRCGICPKEGAPPCTALRLLALPYAQHPAYQPEWSIARPDAPSISDLPRQRSGGVAPLLHQRMADLPAPRGSALDEPRPPTE